MKTTKDISVVGLAWMAADLAKHSDDPKAFLLDLAHKSSGEIRKMLVFQAHVVDACRPKTYDEILSWRK